MALTAENNSPEVQKTNLNDPFKIVAAYLKRGVSGFSTSSTKHGIYSQLSLEERLQILLTHLGSQLVRGLKI